MVKNISTGKKSDLRQVKYRTPVFPQIYVLLIASTIIRNFSSVIFSGKLLWTEKKKIIISKISVERRPSILGLTHATAASG